ncbi:MAG: type III-B CRISPR module RAMP protein Cmr6 [Aquificota bacterium]|nr:type III-B CRISPR module RAMP protein Cmr6 [Aquificota bacterium]
MRKENLSIDVMNNHYGEYYSEKGKEPPADWYNPNPVFFLTLEGVSFRFYIGVEKHIPEGNELLEEALKLLKEGLELFGLGAKRRKGMGGLSLNPGEGITLISFVGKAREDRGGGRRYIKTRYRFDDGSVYEATFFGSALIKHLGKDVERCMFVRYERLHVERTCRAVAGKRSGRPPPDHGRAGQLRR